MVIMPDADWDKAADALIGSAGERCMADSVATLVGRVGDRMVSVADLNQAIVLVNSHEYGNGVSIVSQDGHAAREFGRSINARMVGINVPNPIPMAWHGCGGWKSRFFCDAYGEDGVRLYTKQKSIMQRWRNTSAAGAELRPVSR